MSPSQLPQLRRAVETLLAPHDHETPEAWLSSAGGTIERLLGADMFSGFLPERETPTGDGFGAKVSSGLHEKALSSWPSVRRPLEHLAGLPALELKIGVGNRATGYGRHLKALYRSAYYNEYCVPNRAYDAIQLTVPADGAAGRAILFFNHTAPVGSRFGRRAFDILWTLYPAFHAGVSSVMAGAGAETGNGRGWPALDALRRPVVVSDLNGHWIHASPAVAELLAKEELEIRGQVADRIKALAQGFHSLLCTARREGEPPTTRHRLRTRHAHITLMASLSAPDAYGAERTVVVELERTELPCEVSPESLRQRVGLTQREMDVAMLLARRRSNVEVSEELQISPHTARHHTERVLSKLQLHARGDVARALGEAGFRTG